jgi:hypothetical protein
MEDQRLPSLSHLTPVFVLPNDREKFYSLEQQTLTSMIMTGIDTLRTFDRFCTIQTLS